MEKQFEVKILNLNWLNKLDKYKNESAYGKVYIRIGEEVISDKSNKGEWTLSTTVLFLMRTVNRNYKIGDFNCQLLPCCGHIMDVGDHAIILGCPNGIDWTIEHIGNDQIRHTSKNGSEGIIGKGNYSKLVIELANQVEKFYQENMTSEKLENHIRQRGYDDFWEEWRQLKIQIEKTTTPHSQ